jgi:hypothetical protein
VSGLRKWAVSFENERAFNGYRTWCSHLEQSR